MKKRCKRKHVLSSDNIYISSKGVIECVLCRKFVHKKYLSDKPWLKHFYAAKRRCLNKKNDYYSRYGGRGICFLTTPNDFKVLWFRDKAYLIERPSIDRINSDGHYVFENCRFISQSKNSSLAVSGEKNRSAKLTKNHVLKIRELLGLGVKQNALVKTFNVSRGTISDILHKRTWKTA